MSDNKIEENTIAEIVADNYKTADVFKQHGIDFCCGGKKTVENVCKEQGVNIQALSDELRAVFNERKSTEDFNSWNLDFLIDYITNTHHRPGQKHQISIEGNK